ncbi:MAG: YfhO family protein, partial [Acidobacteria bacterium]|nr:YfhO family protein [Acidobacteriota bacterium]
MKRLVCGFFLVLSVLHTWPLTAGLPSQIKDDHDAILNVWTLGAIAQQVVKDPLHPLNVNMFYPFDAALATLDPQLANGTIAAPVTWVSGNPVLGHNVFILATFVLSGLTMFLLVRELTGSVAAGLIAGCLYAFSPFRTNRLSHTHMLAGFWLPLMLLWIHRYVAEPRWGRLLVVVGVFVALALSSWYLAAMGVVAALIVGIWSLAAHGHARAAVPRAVAGVLLVFLILLPFGLPFARVKAWETSGGSGDVHTERAVAPLLERTRRLFDRQLDIGGRAKTSAELQHYFGVGPDARLWRSLRPLGFAEGSFFPGAIGLALALLGCATGLSRRMANVPLAAVAILPATAIVCAGLGWEDAWPVIVTRRGSLVVVMLLGVALWSLWRIRRDGATRTNTIVRTYIALIVAGMLLSFGPQVRAFGVDLGAGVYPSFVPPFGVLRVPARFGVLFTVGIAVLAGLGAAWIESRIQRRARWGALAGALLVINLEHAVAPMKFVSVPRITPSDTWLKNAPAGPVVVFPTHNNPWALLNSLFHRKPIVNGSGLVAPPPYVRLNARDDLSPAMIEH